MGPPDDPAIDPASNPVIDPVIDVVVIGDANPDIVLRGDVVPRFGQAEQLLESADLTLGGSAAIVACGLARLGVRTALVSIVGDDAYGAFVIETLAARGVITRWLRTHPSLPTGLSIVLSGATDRAILTFPGAISALNANHANEQLLASVRHVHAASPFLQPTLTTQLPDLFATVRRAGATTSLDTNWDPAQEWMTIAATLRETDVLLPNVAELSALDAALRGVAVEVGALTDDPIADAARRFTVAGLTVALKDGAAGGRVWTPGGGEARVPGLTVDVVDTTGAGDSFDAGYLAGLVEGRTPSECLELAVITGSLSTRAAGGTGGQADRAELAAVRASR